jgi:glucose/arabinose dehydrogenase
MTAMLLVAAPANAGMSLVPAYTDSVPDPVDTPIYVTAPPGDTSRLFVVERGGRIRVAVNGVIQDTPFLDITSRVSTNGEGGLLSMAFAPDYATSRNFYVYFVQQSDGHIHVEQFKRSLTDPNVADPTATTPLLDVAHPTFTNHYGGQIAFGPDGELYAGTGDGGSSNDPAGNAQNDASQLGKLLAINTAGPSLTTAAKGLRNPFRFSFDRGTGDLIVGDVGQAKWEEVVWVPATDTLAGSNFGWDCYEALEHVDTGCDPSPRVDPVIFYANPNGSNPPSAAVTGGVVVRDPALTPVFGRYLYADFYAGQVHSAALAKPVTDDRIESSLGTTSMLVAFGEDASGQVYVVSLTGTVERIVCDSTCPSGGTGGGTTSPPPPGPESPPAADQPPTVVGRDSAAPVLRIRVARRQDVLRRHVVRLSVACDENCLVRVTARIRRAAVTRGSGRAAVASDRRGRASGPAAHVAALGLRGALKRLVAGKRVVFELRASARVRRALERHGVIALSIRGRDAAGNLRTATRTVRVKR